MIATALIVRCAAACAALTPVLLLTPVAPQSSAGAQGFSAFEAVAAADGARYTLTAPGVTLIDTIVDAAAPSTQSAIDGLGNSRAYAAFPYPGEDALTLPGTAAGLLGLPELPQYPLIAASAHPSEPQAEVDHPGVKLVARSGDASSTANAVASGPASQEMVVARLMTSAVSTVDRETGTLSAEAATTAEIVELAGVLRIGRVYASADVAKAGGDGDLERASSITVEQATVAGTSVEITEDGIMLGGTNTPLPDTSPLAKLLQEAGISVHVVRGVETEDGIISGAVVVEVKQRLPSGEMAVQRFQFGHAVARVSGTFEAEALPSSIEPTVTSTPSVEEPTDAALSSDATHAADATVPSSRSSGTQPSTSPSGSGATEQSSNPVRSVTPGGMLESSGVLGFYAVLVLAAVSALGGTQLIRLRGVKYPWTY